MTTFVWAHAGHGPADVVRRLLERNPNLLADLSARTPWIGPGTVLLDPSGALQPAWAALLRDLSERLLVGLDLFAPDRYRAEYARRLAEFYRGLLGRLPSAVAERSGWGKAARVAPRAASARQLLKPRDGAGEPG